MSTSQAIAGPGFLIDYEDPTDSGIWKHVIEVEDITGPSETTDTIEVTNQDSDGGYKEYFSTLQDGGTVTFPSHFIPSDTDQQAMLTHKHNRDTLNWRIRLADSGYAVFFAALITNLGFAFPRGGVAGMNVTLKVTGPVTSGVLTSL